MVLTEKQKQVLSVAQLHADLPAHEIARRARTHPRTVRYVLARLNDHGLIRRRSLLNPTVVGFQFFHLLLSVAPESVMVADKFAKFLAETSSLSDLNYIGGEYHYELLLLGRSMNDVAVYLDEIAKRFGPILQTREVSVVRSWRLWGSRWLAQTSVSAPSLEWETRPCEEKFDSIDFRIMRIIAERGEHSNRDLARALKLSASTFEYRVNRLKANGAFCGDFYELHPEWMGMHSYRFLLQSRVLSADFDKRLRKLCQEHRSIDILVKTFGVWDYLMHVQVERPQQANVLSQTLLAAFPKELSVVKVIPRFENITFCPFPVCEH